MTVPVDQTRRVTLSGQADSVVIGNRDIAEVSIINTRNLMVIGKKLGVTNLVVLDANGRSLFDSEIVISAGAGQVMSVYRGGVAAEYACTPYCQQVSGDAGLQPAPATVPPAATTTTTTTTTPATGAAGAPAARAP